MKASLNIRPRAAWLGCGVLALMLGACSSDKTPAKEPSNVADQRPAPAAVSTPTANAAASGETSVRLSEEILRECRFPANPEDLPLFDVDQATLRPRGRDVLADVANCMKDGPLQHRTITIVGRADPRGTDAHNHALGANRAEATRTYLIQRGVAESKVLVVSRGEESASGTEEQGWALDRRVDLVLGDRTERTSITENPPANAKKATPANNAASSYADQSEGGPASGKVTGTSGPGTDSVSGK
jgi:peptidoglycan-associated lipoprotein